MTHHVHILARPLVADCVSSHRCTARGHDDELITPHKEWIALGVDHRSRCSAYRALFNDAPGKSPIDQIRFSNRRGHALGRKSFKSQVEEQLQIRLGSGKAGRPPKSD